MYINIPKPLWVPHCGFFIIIINQKFLCILSCKLLREWRIYIKRTVKMIYLYQFNYFDIWPPNKGPNIPILYGHTFFDHYWAIFDQFRWNLHKIPLSIDIGHQKSWLCYLFAVLIFLGLFCGSGARQIPKNYNYRHIPYPGEVEKVNRSIFHAKKQGNCLSQNLSTFWIAFGKIWLYYIKFGSHRYLGWLIMNVHLNL